jgi:hypothetical protein
MAREDARPANAQRAAAGRCHIRAPTAKARAFRIESPYPRQYDLETNSMNLRSTGKAAIAIAILLTACPVAFPQAIPASNAPAIAPISIPAKPGGKELLIPARITRVPATNDFNHPDSEFSFQRSKSSDNFVLFWAKEYGDYPMTNSVANRRFNVDEVLKEADRFYNYYVDTLKWVDKDKSLATKYKFLFFVIGGTGGTAFGGQHRQQDRSLLDARHPHQPWPLRRGRS